MTKERKALELYRLIAVAGYDQASAVAEIVTALEKAEKDGFNSGYMLACCNLTNMHDQPGLASDVLAEAGMTEADVAAMGLSEYDRRALAEIRKGRATNPLA
jgi:hypothetical protein